MHRSLALASLLVALPAVALAQPSATPVAPAVPEAAPPPADVAPPAAPVAAPDPDTDAAVSGPAPIAPAAPAVAPPAAAPPSAAPVVPTRPAAVPLQFAAPVYGTPAERGIAAAQREDAALHRAYVSGTAVTVPRGAAVVDIRQPLFPAGTLGINVGLTDRWQVSGDVLWVLLFDEGEGFAYSLGTKLQLIRSDRFALAAHGSLMGADDENAVMGGLIASACLDGDCRALLTGHVTALIAGEDLDDLGDDTDCGYDCYEDDTVEIPVVAGGSLIAGNDTAKVVLELHVAGDDYETAVGAYAGVRFPGRKVSFDVGFVAGAEDDDGGVLPLPLFGLSGRL